MATSTTTQASALSTKQERESAQPAKTSTMFAQKHTSLTNVTYHLHTLYLISHSNILTFVLPNTLFGLLSALSPRLLTTSTPTLTMLLPRLPILLLFNYLNVFIFDLLNQSPAATTEDALNKPWRPVPAGRATPAHLRRLALLAAPCILALAALFSVAKHTAALFALSYLYNDLHAGDTIARDAIIALAFALYNHGSLILAAGTPSHHVAVSSEGYTWITLVSTVILTTMQVQDLKDQAGDATRGRKTLPLLFGETASRWSIAALELVWGVVCAWFWGLAWWGYGVPVGVGGWVAWRVVSRRGPREDDGTWKAWCAWTVALYCLPVMRGWIGRVGFRAG